MAKKGKREVASTTTVEEQRDGTVVLHHHVKEWQPQSKDSLDKIEATIDSWGRGNAGTGLASAELTTSARDLDHEYVDAQVDRITKRVKGSQKVTITETVTEWVEGPVGSGPIAVEEDEAKDVDAAWSAKQFRAKDGKSEKPKRKFSLFGRKDKKAEKKADEKEDTKAAAARDTADKDYQPQCVALTDDGSQCRNSARAGSRYCSSHKGYQPPTAKGLAQRIEGDAWDPDDHVTDHESVRSKDTRPAVKKAPDTRLRTRKARRSQRGRKKR